MSPELFAELSNGNEAFLHEHTTFQEDLKKAVQEMEEMIEGSAFMEKPNSFAN